MLWYLLSPLRGTTEPPTLSNNHPIRRAFYRHGKTTAQHWLLAMLVSVAIGAGLSYPTIFLSENPTARLPTSLPHQGWTTAKNFDGDASVKADVEMRQIWVHGSYMQALDKHVLKSALEIQQGFVGVDHVRADLSQPLGDEKLRWGFHSPLMYWNNSVDLLEKDDNLLRTINEQARSSSALNIALRPASVFASKSFDGHRLQAADGLVLTFINKAGDQVGGRWQSQMQSLSQTCHECTAFPAGGNIGENRVYEFSFIPLSLKENIALAFAYGCVALYVLLSLRRIRAFHSRFGLVVTAITQLTTSILASFTICGVLDINLASIPQNAYPFVVLVVGLENMFRLINAILAYPSTMATELRIGSALGDVGPLKMATAAQNLLILWALSNVVSPGVAAFCAFAAIATLCDTFFLLTFFVAVLSVDIRRLELQDAIVKSENSHKKRRRSPSKRSWFDALVQGRLPFSTRMAGTAVTTTFILSLNYHFFDHQDRATNLRSLVQLFQHDPSRIAPADTFAPHAVNATLTPGEWMALQGFDSAREVMRLVKPGANSFTVRVFLPLIIVLAGADRTGVPKGHEAWTTALRKIALGHLYPFAVVVGFVVTFVAVLMNFLLWNEAADETDTNADRNADTKLAVQTLALPHRLDIVKMTSDSRGHNILTLALDRTLALSTFDHHQGVYIVNTFPASITSMLKWPIHEAVIEDQGDWVALICGDYRVTLYNQSTDSILTDQLELPDDHPILLAKFFRMSHDNFAFAYFTIVTAGGRFLTVCLETGQTKIGDLTAVPIVGAALIDSYLNKGEKHLFVVSDEAELASFRLDAGMWKRYLSQPLPDIGKPGRISDAVKIGSPDDVGLDTVYVMGPTWLILVRGSTLTATDRLCSEELDQPRGNVVFGQSTSCAACGGAAVRSFAVTCEGADADGCKLVAILPPAGDGGTCCLRGAKPTCGRLAEASVNVVSLADAGNWLDPGSQAIIGFRRKPQSTPCQESSSSKSADGKSQLRNRQRKRSRASSMAGEKAWEAYKLALDGELETLQVPSISESDRVEPALFVNELGPIVALSPQTVAVAFGNTVKVVRSVRRGSISRSAKATASERSSLDMRTV